MPVVVGSALPRFAAVGHRLEWIIDGLPVAGDRIEQQVISRVLTHDHSVPDCASPR